jgi:hypothetical protein
MLVPPKRVILTAGIISKSANTEKQKLVFAPSKPLFTANLMSYHSACLQLLYGEVRRSEISKAVIANEAKQSRSL